MGWMNPEDIKTENVEMFRNVLLDRGMSRLTAARYLSTLRAGLGDKGEHLKIGKLISELKRGPVKVECWTKEEAAALINHLHTVETSELFAYFVSFLFRTGMRRGEALALHRSDYDPDRERIHIHRALTLDGEIQNGTKFGGERYYPVSPNLYGIIAVLFSLGGSDLFFPGFDQRNVSRKFARKCKEAGVPQHKLHCTRHSAISWALCAGMSLRKASEIFGVSQATLEKHYAHFVDEKVDMSWAEL
jgi:integrase